MLVGFASPRLRNFALKVERRIKKGQLTDAAVIVRTAMDLLKEGGESKNISTRQISEALAPFDSFACGLSLAFLNVAPVLGRIAVSQIGLPTDWDARASRIIPT
jgi:hypothetical protein